MSIYISDMKIPTAGHILIVFPSGRTLEVSADSAQNIFGEAQAVPVPPHGRLGDLDALAQQIEHKRFHHTHTDGLAARHHVAEYGHFLKAISDAPTIIPANTVLENEIHIIDTKGKSNYDPKCRFVISSPTIISADKNINIQKEFLQNWHEEGDE